MMANTDREWLEQCVRFFRKEAARSIRNARRTLRLMNKAEKFCEMMWGRRGSQVMVTPSAKNKKKTTVSSKKKKKMVYSSTPSSSSPTPKKKTSKKELNITTDDVPVDAASNAKIIKTQRKSITMTKDILQEVAVDIQPHVEPAFIDKAVATGGAAVFKKSGAVFFTRPLAGRGSRSVAAVKQDPPSEPSLERMILDYRKREQEAIEEGDYELARMLHQLIVSTEANMNRFGGNRGLRRGGREDGAKE